MELYNMSQQIINGNRATNPRSKLISEGDLLTLQQRNRALRNGKSRWVSIMTKWTSTGNETNSWRTSGNVSQNIVCTTPHCTKIIFGDDRNPRLVYTDLATGERTDGTKDIASFPGYEFNPKGIDESRYKSKIISGKSIYKKI